MSADHLQFLKDKFIRDLEEAMEEFGDELLPLRLHFEEVSKVLQEWRIRPSTPIKMKDPLYDLRYVLGDCRIFAEKESDQNRENKKSSSSLVFINVHYNVKKLLFLCQTRRKLVRIKRKLLQGMNKVDAAAAAAVERELPSSELVTTHLSFPTLDVSKIHGFHDYFQKIEAILLETTPADGGIRAIGIVGMAGSGKSTLAQMLFQSQFVRRRFSPMIWVQLSVEFNPGNADSRKTIVREILGCSPDKFFRKWTDRDEAELLQALHLYLLNKKYLIVLDNMCHESDWFYGLDSTDDGTSNFTRLTHGLPKGSGGAVIVTSRLEGVASRMVGGGGEHNLHRIHHQPSLDSDACWSIFMDTIKDKNFVKNSDKYPTLLNMMKEEIGDQCDGLPLAAKILAEVISIQIGKEGYWSDRKVEKDIVLRLDVHNNKSMRMAYEIILSFPGVLYVDSALDKEFFWEPKELWIQGLSSGDRFGNTFRVVGAYDLLNLVRELENSWYTELISVERERA